MLLYIQNIYGYLVTIWWGIEGSYDLLGAASRAGDPFCTPPIIGCSAVLERRSGGCASSMSGAEEAGPWVEWGWVGHCLTHPFLFYYFLVYFETSY